KAESPSLESSDSETTAKLFRNHVLGGATIPEHWFGGGGDVNRSTSESMGDPTFKMMSLRQAFVGYMLSEMGRYVIRQWELAHTGNEPDLTDAVFAFSVQFPEMIAKDAAKYAAALDQVTKAVSLAVTSKLMTIKTGVQVIESIAGRLGVSYDAAKELTELLADRTASPPKDWQSSKTQKITEAVATKNKPVFTADQQIIEELADDVLDVLGSPISETDIENAIKSASSYEDLADRLAVLLGGSDSDEFITVLERATFKADLLGFANARRD
ncbi:MAG: hypothetical protein QX189_03605, partial [Methylococcales bacterium]